MSPEEQVRSALKALAEHDRGLESGTPAEAIFAQRRVARSGFRKRWMWLGAIAAAAAGAFAAWTYQPMPHQKLRMEVTASIDELNALEAAKTVAASTAPPPAPRPVRRKRRVRPSPEAPPSQEVVTDFFLLMDAPPPFERGQLVRMVVPAVTMRNVGLPIAPERWNDRVQADVLVGEEGMARAIRFVSFTQ